MMKVLVALATTALTLSLSGCPAEDGGASHDPSEGSRPRHQPQVAAPPPANPDKGNEGDHGAEPAPVQGDPSAHNHEPGELDLHVEWQAESHTATPACEWSINKPGVGQPCANIQRPEKAHSYDRYYLGMWEYEVRPSPKGGDVVYLSAEGTGAFRWLRCSYYWKGAYHELPNDGSGRHCGGTATLS